MAKAEATKETTVAHTREMCQFLSARMREILDGKLDKERASGICNMSQQIYNMLNIEIRTALALNKLKTDRIRPVSFDD